MWVSRPLFGSRHMTLASPDHGNRLSGSECSKSCDTSSLEVQAKLVNCHTICRICCPLCQLLASSSWVRSWVPHTMCAETSVSATCANSEMCRMCQHETWNIVISITINRSQSHSIIYTHTSVETDQERTNNVMLISRWQINETDCLDSLTYATACHNIFWAGLIYYGSRRLNQLLCMLITSLI